MESGLTLMILGVLIATSIVKFNMQNTQLIKSCSLINTKHLIHSIKKKKKSSCMKRVNTINSKNSIDRKGEKYCGA